MEVWVVFCGSDSNDGNDEEHLYGIYSSRMNAVITINNHTDSILNMLRENSRDYSITKEGEEWNRGKVIVKDNDRNIKYWARYCPINVSDKPSFGRIEGAIS